MEFDDLVDINSDLQQRLSSWRNLPGVVEHSPKLASETSVNIEEVRTRQRRIATMCLNLAQTHDAFLGQLKDFLANAQHRDAMHQQRVEEEAAFTLAVFEQTTAISLGKGIQHELENLPVEVIQTVYVSPPAPPKSWFQRMLGI
jgi:hypothetical protein